MTRTLHGAVVMPVYMKTFLTFRTKLRCCAFSLLK
jgi:hypothetical protein